MRKPVRAVGRSAGRCINPKIGEHPDLFIKTSAGEPAMTGVWTPEEAPPPDDEPYAQYAKDAKKARLRELPRASFDEDEWEELDADDQEYIHEHDPESAARIKALVDAFVESEKYLLEPDEQTKAYWIEQNMDYFHQWLGEQDEIVDNRGIRDEVHDLLIQLRSAGSDDEVRGAINEALRDADNYNFSISDNEYRAEGVFKERVFGTDIYFSKEDLAELTDPMFNDEVEEAVKQINHDTHLHLKYDDLFPRYEFQQEYEVNFYFVADPDWDKIYAAARETLGQGVVEETASPPESRIVYKFKDGFYVVDLLSSELKAEGAAQGICVGQSQYGYAGAVKRGDTKIFSLRRPSGKPLFTIEASMGRPSGGRGAEMGQDPFSTPSEVIEIRQIKGKANRLPGWDAGKSGEGEMKVDEVQKAVEFVRSLGISPDTVRDLRPAIEWATKNHLQWKEPASLGPRQNPRRLPPLPMNDRPMGFDSYWTP